MTGQSRLAFGLTLSPWPAPADDFVGSRSLAEKDGGKCTPERGGHEGEGPVISPAVRLKCKSQTSGIYLSIAR
jgi:hypothetical protein